MSSIGTEHTFEPPVLTDVQERVVGLLRRDGIAVVPFRELFDDVLWAECEADIGSFVEKTEKVVRSVGEKPGGKDPVIVRRFREKKERKPMFTPDSPWLRFAASEAILDIVNTYRGRWTKLYYLDNWVTVPYPASDERVGSQRWHRDPEDAHVVKVFCYFSDVDEEAGPFEYIRSSPSGGRYGHLWPWGEAKSYPPQDELAAAVAPDDRLTLTGPPGTVIFCDTGGFHRGGFARTKPRVLAMCTLVPPGARDSRRFEVDLEGRESELPAQIRYALD